MMVSWALVCRYGDVDGYVRLRLYLRSSRFWCSCVHCRMLSICVLHASIPAESASPTFVTAPVLEASPVVGSSVRVQWCPTLTHSDKEVEATSQTSSTHSTKSVGLVERRIPLTLLSRPLTTAAPHTTVLPGTAARPFSTTTFAFRTTSWWDPKHRQTLADSTLRQRCQRTTIHLSRDDCIAQRKTVKDTAARSRKRGATSHSRGEGIQHSTHCLEEVILPSRLQQITSHRR